jgi:hypothetical protein
MATGQIAVCNQERHHVVPKRHGRAGIADTQTSSEIVLAGTNLGRTGGAVRPVHVSLALLIVTAESGAKNRE